jgi:hypothetical protein
MRYKRTNCHVDSGSPNRGVSLFDEAINRGNRLLWVDRDMHDQNFRPRDLVLGLNE